MTLLVAVLAAILGATVGALFPEEVRAFGRGLHSWTIGLIGRARAAFAEWRARRKGGQS